jgi:hypothetical protein
MVAITRWELPATSGLLDRKLQLSGRHASGVKTLSELALIYAVHLEATKVAMLKNPSVSHGHIAMVWGKMMAPEYLIMKQADSVPCTGDAHRPLEKAAAPACELNHPS